MKRPILSIIILCMSSLCMVAFTACQKTPDKSSVVSKADGLSKELIAKPLKPGEKRSIDMPDNWTASEKKSNDRVTISANLDLGKLETDNLPVVEMKNHTMTQKELEKLVKHFAGSEEIYVPQVDTKDVFQKVKDRIDKREGAYANPSLGSFTDMKSSLDDAIKLAPEIPPKKQKAELKFKKKTEDEVQEAANSWITKLGVKKEQISDASAFFTADIGERRLSHIKAECYDPDIANSSKFVWRTGTDYYDSDNIQQSMRMNEFNTDTSGYKEKLRDILNQYQKALEQQPFSMEDGQKKAEKLMADLDVPAMSLLSAEKTLWFPEEVMPDTKYGQQEDFYWQADLTKAKTGYKYVFTRAFGGIPSEQSSGAATKKTTKAYASPFPVETVSITVTDDGVKTFSWEGMCKEMSAIAKNVKLLSFHDIQKQLFEQVFYQYLEEGQPKEDPTKFTYKVTAAKLRYTYVTAFNKPEDAWLIPAWFFEVMQGEGLGEDIKDLSSFSVTINAMDGGAIVQNSN